MKKTILFVDDIEDRFVSFVKYFPEHEVAFGQTLDEACVLLLQYQWDCVYLDHDNMLMGPKNSLGDFDVISSTWRPVACMLAAMKYPGKVILHSANPAGREWMYLLLKDAGVDVEDNGFPSTIFGNDG